MKIIFTTALALIAFAANSIINRLALGEGHIDAASFTAVRLLSGAITLTLLNTAIQRSTNNKTPFTKKATGSWKAGTALFIYALTFSYSYLHLDTGVGALILFGTVQITMILASFIAGKKLRLLEWIGISTAFLGFIYLIFPQLSTPSFTGLVLMTIAGISWAGYTLMGRESTHPLQDTAYNFLRALPLVVVLLAVTFQTAHIRSQGIWLAILSGSLASGLGYAIWYHALKSLTATRAAVVQLLVPIFAAAGGFIFIQEAITSRLLLSSLFILGGILLVVMGKEKNSTT